MGARYLETPVPRAATGSCTPRLRAYSHPWDWLSAEWGTVYHGQLWWVSLAGGAHGLGLLALDHLGYKHSQNNLETGYITVEEKKRYIYSWTYIAQDSQWLAWGKPISFAPQFTRTGSATEAASWLRAGCALGHSVDTTEPFKTWC